MADTTDASDPFSPTSDEMNPPDVIIRASDMVDFHAHKAILSFGSIVFKDMFSFPEPRGEDANLTKDGKPVIALPESSKTIEKLLILCYPRFASSYLLDLDGVDGAYEAARKYQIPGGQQLLRQLLRDPRFLEKNPHRVFAIACHRGIEDSAKLAARETLKFPRYIPYLSVPEWDFIPARHLRRLEDFHYRCSQEVASVVGEFSWPVDIVEDFDEEGRPPEADYVWWQGTGHATGCGPEELEGCMYHPAPWFKEHVDRVVQAGQHVPDEHSLAKVMGDVDGPTLAAISNCFKCARLAPTHLTAKGWILISQLEEIYTSILEKFSFVG
ncbi:hypothetical protein DFH07DRAFT_966826 [Mycena maculata]|uniref:BTB domain-containing protein n=1 Tax=Mycena maculata TaxID=230809 RepID=A0AAD7MYN4_9AGAR|nr:hypothetical protein DFH07DRAFT_966826 [Mycena maculata]